MSRRCFVIPALAFTFLVATATAVQNENKVILKVDGKLTAQDPKDKVRKDCHCKIHTIKLEEGATYQIDLIGPDGLDTWLRLEDSKEVQLAEDDDGGDGFNARIIFAAKKSDTYRIIATTFEDGATGPYTLIVTQTSPPAKREKEEKK